MGSWDFESGLADDFDLEITNAYFQYSPKLAREGDPQIALHLEGKAEGGSFEAPTTLDEETALLFTVGSKWMVTDEGSKLVDEGGRDRGFQENTSIARLLKSAVQAGTPLRERGEATDAKIWVGLKLHFKRKPVQMGGNIGERNVLFVDKFVGEAEGGAKKAAAKPTKAAPATEEGGEASGNEDVDMIKTEVGGPIFKRMQKLATESEDYDTWASEASGLPKVSDNEKVQEAILTEDRGTAVWEALRAE